MTTKTKKMLTGYCNLSVQPVDALNFMVSAQGCTTAEVNIVRLIHGDESAQGPGYVDEPVEAVCNGMIAVTEQNTAPAGNFVEVVDVDAQLFPQGSFSVHAFIWPTTPAAGRQGLVTQWSEAQQKGFAFEIDTNGCLCLRLGDGKNSAVTVAKSPLMARIWYFIAASYDVETSQVTLFQLPVVNSYNSHLSPLVVDREPKSHTQASQVQPISANVSLIWGGYHGSDTEKSISGFYNGKIDRVAIHSQVVGNKELTEISRGVEPGGSGLVANWDTTLGYTDQGIGDLVIDTGPHGLNGIGYNRPVRGMTGYNWNGEVDCYRLNPSQFGGIHFHADAITDCAWVPTFSWTIPENLKSGVYAAWIHTEEVEDHIVFFVRPTKPQAKVAMLMPTASYLAYANEHFVLHGPAVEAVTAHPLILSDRDYALSQHPEWGLSSYDHHVDGAGVCYTSYLRPIMGMRPKHRMAATGVPWQFPADLSIIWWLENQNIEYDVITDEDLHREGVDCLSSYKLIINGTHSEYYSEEMMDATEQYLDDGGHLFYSGGNGYYWVVAFRDDDPTCMEIRKLDTGTRAWQAEPGEFYMATNGRKGGLWRARGRLPQKLLGVGFTSEGMDESKPYRRMPDSFQEEVSWIFAGVENDLFGDSGLALDGAAGIEIDRYDLSLGTPPNTWLLASSEGHSDNYPHVSEEIGFNFPGMGGSQDPQVRADLTYFVGVNGGSVLSTGSIAWGQALPINGGDNDVSRITANVVRRLAGDP
ncbi:MAG: LamG domain-containing protein [Gammaproteobacteria bacterium]|nr:LamG domain-containing protein [Gammaproteobacteria bacterium]